MHPPAGGQLPVFPGATPPDACAKACAGPPGPATPTLGVAPPYAVASSPAASGACEWMCRNQLASRAARHYAPPTLR